MSRCLATVNFFGGLLDYECNQPSDSLDHDFDFHSRACVTAPTICTGHRYSPDVFSVMITEILGPEAVADEEDNNDRCESVV